MTLMEAELQRIHSTQESIPIAPAIPAAVATNNDRSSSWNPNALTLDSGVQDLLSPAVEVPHNCDKVCHPWKDLGGLRAEIASYQQSAKFRHKIQELRGKRKSGRRQRHITYFLQRKLLSPDTDVIDLGCAAGHLTKIASKLTPAGTTVGVELVPGWVKAAKLYTENITFVEADVTSPMLAYRVATELTADAELGGGGFRRVGSTTAATTRRFDLVLMNDVMEHIPPERLPCLWSNLERFSHPRTVVYLHHPLPASQRNAIARAKRGKGKTQFYESALSRADLDWLARCWGFKLVWWEQDDKKFAHVVLQRQDAPAPWAPLPWPRDGSGDAAAAPPPPLAAAAAAAAAVTRGTPVLPRCRGGGCDKEIAAIPAIAPAATRSTYRYERGYERPLGERLRADPRLRWADGYQYANAAGANAVSRIVPAKPAPAFLDPPGTLAGSQQQGAPQEEADPFAAPLPLTTFLNEQARARENRDRMNEYLQAGRPVF